MDTISLDGDVEDDDITEPIAACTTHSPANGVSVTSVTSVRCLDTADIKEMATSEIPAGIECHNIVSDNSNVTSITVNGDDDNIASDSDDADMYSSIIDEEGFNLDEFIVYVRNNLTCKSYGTYERLSQPNRSITRKYYEMALRTNLETISKWLAISVQQVPCLLQGMRLLYVPRI